MGAIAIVIMIIWLIYHFTRPSNLKSLSKEKKYDIVDTAVTIINFIPEDKREEIDGMLLPRDDPRAEAFYRAVINAFSNPEFCIYEEAKYSEQPYENVLKNIIFRTEAEQRGSYLGWLASKYYSVTANKNIEAIVHNENGIVDVIKQKNK